MMNFWNNNVFSCYHTTVFIFSTQNPSCSCSSSSPPHCVCPERHKHHKLPLVIHVRDTESEPSQSVKTSSPPPAAAPARRSGASAAAPCRRRLGAPGALWSELSERLPARVLSARPGASAAPPPDTRGRQWEDLHSDLPSSSLSVTGCLVGGLLLHDVTPN